MVSVVLLLRYSSRESTFWLEAEELSVCCCCSFPVGSLINVKNECRAGPCQHGRGQEAGKAMGLHAHCAMVQMGAN